MNIRRIINWTGLFAAFACGLYAVAYLMVSRSAAFEYAEQQIVASAKVANRIGIGASATLAPLEFFEYEFVGDDVHAEMRLNVSGTKGREAVQVVINKLDNKWRMEAKYPNGDRYEF